MVYKPFLADLDIWTRPMKRSSDGFEHYEYVHLYVNGVLAIGDDPTEVLKKIDNFLD